VRCDFARFGDLQRRLEEREITPISAESEYVPLNPVELPDDQATEVLKLVDRIEQDDDVQKVFHNLV
jgi:transcriptional/translational regulatory protein YebC/TACO1